MTVLFPRQGGILAIDHSIYAAWQRIRSHAVMSLQLGFIVFVHFFGGKRRSIFLQKLCVHDLR